MNICHHRKKNPDTSYTLTTVHELETVFKFFFHKYCRILKAVKITTFITVVQEITAYRSAARSIIRIPA